MRYARQAAATDNDCDFPVTDGAASTCKFITDMKRLNL